MNFIFPREDNKWISIVMLGVNPLAFGLVMIALLKVKYSLFNSETLYSKIGVCSYSIYLWHPLVNTFLYKTLQQLSKKYFILNYYIYFVLYLIIAVLVGVIFTKIIEGPFLKFRDRYYPSRGKAFVLRQ